MRRTILPFALAPLALGAIPPGLTDPAAAQALPAVPAPQRPPQQTLPQPAPQSPATPQPPDAEQPLSEQEDAPLAGVSPLPEVPAPPQERTGARTGQPTPPTPEAPPVLDRPVIGGPEVTAEIQQSFELDTNLDLDEDSPGTSYFAETRLSFGLIDETPVQSLSFGFDTGVRALWPADDDFEWTFASPSSANAGYAREWASGGFEAGIALRQRRVDFSRDLFDFFDPDLDVIVVPDDPAELEGDATERRYDASFALGLATDAPSSYAFELSANRIDYDESAGDLTPRTTVQGSATWTLAVSPLFSGTLAGRGFFYEADNEAETQIRETEIDAGVIYDPSAVFRLSGGVGIVQRTREQRTGGTGAVEEEDETGLAFRAGANYTFEDFVVNAGLRATTTPEFRVSGNVNVNYPFTGGTVNARAFQSFAGGTGGDEIRVLGAGIGITRELDAFASVRFDLSASRRSNEDDPNDPDVTRIDFSTSLGYDFTERISADLGYRYRAIDDDPTEADSHAVFVQVGRAFVTGF